MKALTSKLEFIYKENGQMAEPIFKASHIVKQFGPTIALNDVSIEIYPGEIRGFIGENGSGKSTRSAIRTGIYEATSGQMEYHGKPWKPKSMIDALQGGIGIIVQENGTIAEVSVAENIFLGELKNFSGEHYFEDKKVENFSPRFSISLDSFDALAKNLSEKSRKADKEGRKAIVSEARKGKLNEIYHTLLGQFDVYSKEEAKRIEEEFNQNAKTIFDAYAEKEKEIDSKYDKNEEGLDSQLVSRRRKHDHQLNEKDYERKVSLLKKTAYLHKTWIKGDETALKNHYLNTIEEISNPEHSRNKVRDAFRKAIFGLFVNGKKLRKHAQLALSNIGANDINPGRITAAYDRQQRKLIEIAKCLNKNPEIFIVDETTTALSETGRILLYKKREELKNQGKSVLFISHDLDELREKCDTLTVLRDGNIVANLSKSKNEFDPDAIKKFRIGRELKGDYYRSDYDSSCSDQVVLKRVDGIEGGQLRHVNLELHKGEILGIGGLSECGRHTLGKALFGNIKREGGYVYVGENLDKLVKSESFARKEKIGYLSKNRDTEALALKSSIFDNIAIASINNIAKANFLVLKRDEKKLVNKQAKDLQIKCNSTEQLVSSLSGGNKQKVSLAKWIANDSQILILDCPTRGVDIGVKQFIYQLLYKRKKEGKSIIRISEELPELIGRADRILIRKDGQINKEFMRSPNLTQEQIVQYRI